MIGDRRRERGRAKTRLAAMVNSGQRAMRFVGDMIYNEAERLAAVSEDC